MEHLIRGYRKFKAEVYPAQRHRFKKLAELQSPSTLFITCSDSRITPAMITQTEPGELFHCRIVGNLVPAHGTSVGGVTSAIEYAVTVLGVRDIIVCGHSDCGAIKAMIHPEKLTGLPAVSRWLEHAQTAIQIAAELHKHLGDEDFLEAVIHENVISQLQHLETHPCVAVRLRKGTLRIHGWYYEIGTGDVYTYDSNRKEFVPLDEEETS